MATIAEITQQVIRIISGGDQNRGSQLDKREVKLAVIQELNQAIKIEYFTNIKAFDDHGVSGQYLATFTADVLWDAIRCENYTVIPTPYIAIGAYDRGIQEVSPLNDSQQTYVPMAQGSKAIHRGLPSGNLEMRVGYYPERDKIYYSTNIKKKGVSKVRLKLIVANGDDLILDPAIESSILQAVIKTFMERGTQNRVDDNVDHK